MAAIWKTAACVTGFAGLMWVAPMATAADATPAPQPENDPVLIRCGTGLEKPRPIEPGDGIGGPGIVAPRPIVLPVDPIEPIRPMPPIEPGPEPVEPVEPGPPANIIEQKPDADGATEQWQQLNQGEVVIVATVTKTEMLMATMSMPPRYGMQFNVAEDAQVLRGNIEGDIEDIAFHYMTLDRATLPKAGDELILSIRPAQQLGGKRYSVTGLYPSDEKTLKLARQAAALPVGWFVNQKEETVSPWARFGETYPAYLFTNAIRDKMKRPTCVKTGRPALAMPEGVTLTVEQIVPDNAKQYINTYGDGKFKITLKNTTDEKVSIPALLAVKDNPGMMLLDESLVILHQGKPVFRPQAKWFSTAMQRMRLSSPPAPVEIEPGKSFSFEFNTLELEGVDWPRGGSRVQFTFALGDVAQTNFFYYFSRHHDKLLPEQPKVETQEAGEESAGNDEPAQEDNASERQVPLDVIILPPAGD